MQPKPDDLKYSSLGPGCRLARREFVKGMMGGGALWALSSTVPVVFRRAALAAGRGFPGEGPVLVVVQLSGGNDGLNTIVPYEDDEYYRKRPTLRLAGRDLHKIDGHLGFHPEMAAFQALYQEGLLGIVQEVGYPNSKRDHDAAMLDWQTAQPDAPFAQTGWIGRWADEVRHSGIAQLGGAFVGHIQTPFSLRTETEVVPWLDSPDQWSFLGRGEGDEEEQFRRRLTRVVQAGAGGAGGELLEKLRRATLEACASSRRVIRSKEIGRPETAPFQLARDLGIVADLIRAETGIRVYVVELGGGGIGGFDTHANQAANHGALLRQLSESIAAFLHQLRRDKLLDQVLLMTFSEFGRTVTENGRRGTDHGAAAPLFLAGGKVRGGLTGPVPNLQKLSGDATEVQIDFRRVYATVLDRWLGFESEGVLGGRFEALDVLQA